MAAIFAASSIPGRSVPAPPILGWDKLVHAVVYAVLAALLVRATGGRLALALAIAILYGVTDELHQALVPGRFADPFDALADAIGALLGVASTLAFSPRAKEETDGDHSQLQGKDPPVR